MHSYIRPNTHIALRLSSDMVKVLQITPNTNINIGKFGSFPANSLIGRPYYLTFELQEKSQGDGKSSLRVVPAAELHAEAVEGDKSTPTESRDEPTDGASSFDIIGEDGEILMRNNRLIIDDPSRQQLSSEEIEELKKAGTNSGKEIIAKIMASHSALDQKTKFSLAKYTLRKSKKYLKRFTVFPLDVGMLTSWVTEREAYKIMELREESLGLISSYANVRCAASNRVLTTEDGISQVGGGRWLVVDDTTGLLTASLAEKMGILYPNEEMEEEESEQEEEGSRDGTLPDATQVAKDAAEIPETTRTAEGIPEANGEPHGRENGGPEPPQDVAMSDAPAEPSTTLSSENPQTEQTSKPRAPRVRKPRVHIPAMSSQTNTITVVHANNQPNLAYLKYFGFDASAPEAPHPLYTHLKSLSWLQLLHPDEDDSYIEPEVLPDHVLHNLKSAKRGNYYKKRRRWEKTARVIEETRRGGFDGLVVASTMEPAAILRELVPLVRGGGKIVVYNNNVEPLVELCDYYSKERRAAFVARQLEDQNHKQENGTGGEDIDEGLAELDDADEDFPVNPTLLLAPMLQTSRARHWQVLPGRTHPLMTSRGGAEGFIFTATRVLPQEGRVEARGNFRGKKRKTGERTAVPV